MDGLVAELLEPTVHVFTCGAKRQARLREQILLGLLGLGLPETIAQLVDMIISSDMI